MSKDRTPIPSDQWLRVEAEFRKCDDLFNEVARAAGIVAGVDSHEAAEYLREARRNFAIAGFWLNKAIKSAGDSV
jgi:hypothetical protein